MIVLKSLQRVVVEEGLLEQLTQIQDIYSKNRIAEAKSKQSNFYLDMEPLK